MVCQKRKPGRTHGIEKMKAYVIVRGIGEYSDRCETPVRVFLNEARAQSVMSYLEKIEARYSGFAKWWNSGPEPVYPYKAKEECRKAYEAMGFDAWFEHDWELCEVDLEP